MPYRWVLAFARSWRSAAGVAVLPTASLTFGGLLLGAIVIIGALSFFAALALGPIAEQLSSHP